MWKRSITALALVLAVTSASAQDAVTTQRTTTVNTDGSRTETVTVDQYQTRLKEAYVSVGLPDTIVSRILPLDVEIYNARVAGDVEKIKTLRQRQIEILTPQWAPKIRTYFTTNPYVVRIGPGPYTVWSDYVVVDGADAEVVDVVVYERRLREIYVSLGIPEAIIVQLIPIDIQIYNAYAGNNITVVTQLQERRLRVLPAEHRTKVETHFREKPFQVKTKSDVTFKAWQSPSETSTESAGTVKQSQTDQARPSTDAGEKATDEKALETRQMDKDPAAGQATQRDTRPDMSPDEGNRPDARTDTGMSQNKQPEGKAETGKAMQEQPSGQSSGAQQKETSPDKSGR